ncbi:Uma2 family endonuclease [Paracraurococcus lichenis]|uniref:Uma2 family endonuclease n=1 Tax=Paracraurococcus lichenis TaxID=3064888 RepID=A0ABT9E7E3_9PROT|nr:Uma2 family endonuclease [Paracraurococcus sp. LOR1-02]MDO9712083.1 Uma2 family endonuclease [Paracraurococcus sp. LOR1-02]
MSAALAAAPPPTLAEFLDWEPRQDAHFEWDGIQPLAMVGRTFLHTELASRVFDALRAALRGTPCSVIRADLRVMTANASRVRYPDLAVTCSPIGPADRVVPAPVFLPEVLSETTGAVDRGIKRQEYAALPSLTRYVMLAHDAPLAIVCDRASGFEERPERETLSIPEFGITLPLAVLYAGLLPG